MQAKMEMGELTAMQSFRLVSHLHWMTHVNAANIFIFTNGLLLFQCWWPVVDRLVVNGI
jgi:hypothetical protein